MAYRARGRREMVAALPSGSTGERAPRACPFADGPEPASSPDAVLDVVLRQPGDACDVRWEWSRTVVIELRATGDSWDVRVPVLAEDSGYACRLWSRGRRYSVHSQADRLEPAQLSRTFRELKRAGLRGASARAVPRLPGGRTTTSHALAAELDGLDLAECVDGIRVALSARAFGRRLRTAGLSKQVWLRLRRRKRLVVNSGGGLHAADDAWASLDLSLSAPWRTVSRGLGTTRFLVDLEISRALAELVHRVEQPATRVPPGTCGVVLDPELAGLFAHEVVAHRFESDGAAGPRMPDEWVRPGTRVARPVVTIYDDPTYAGAYGHYERDDEGTAAWRTCLIKEGCVSDVLHSSETAALTGARSRGNGRAQSWRHLPIARA